MNILEYFYPEVRAGGYSRVDGTVEFYGRIHALLEPEMTILDFGAGRGAGAKDDPVRYRRKLRTLKGACAKVIGADIDPVVMENPSVDTAIVIDPDKSLPLADSSVDMIVSSSVFEHIENPGFVSQELDRILRPGGWLLARTPNKWGYIGMGANLVPNRWHTQWLKRLQPHRKEEDVFPTCYQMNTRRRLKRLFPPDRYSHYTYGYFPEPVYFGNSRLMWRFMLFSFRITPELMAPILIIVLRKNELR